MKRLLGTTLAMVLALAGAVALAGSAGNYPINLDSAPSTFMTTHGLVVATNKQGAKSLTDLGTTSKVLIGNAIGDPTWGTLPSGAFGPLTGDVTSAAYVTTVAAIQGVTVTGNTGTGKVVRDTSPTLSGVTITGAGGTCTNQFVKALSTALAITCATINLASDVTGTLPSGSFGPLTGDVTTSGYAATLAKISGIAASRVVAVDGSKAPTGSFASSVLLNSLTDETGTGVSVFSASPTFTGTAIFAGVTITGAGGTCTNQFVRSISTAMVATCASVNLASDVTGTLPVGNGGTGAATFASNGVLYGNSTSAIQALAVNSTATHEYLQQFSSGTPAWAQVDFTDLSGTAACTQIPAPSGDINGTGGCGLAVVGVAGATSVIRSATTTLPQFVVDTAAGNARTYAFETGGLLRWGLRADSTAEGGSNAGSNFVLRRFDDSGTAIDNPLTVARSTGVLTIADGVAITGAGGTCTNQFVKALSTALAITCATINLATDVTGTLPSGSFGPLTGDVTTSGYAATLAKIAGITASRVVGVDASNNVTSSFASAALLASLSDETGTGVAVFSASPTFTGTATFAAVVITGAGGTCTNQFVRSISTAMVATCASVNLASDVTGLLPFSALTSLPTTLAGYGITDGLKTTNNLSDVANPITAINNLKHWSITTTAQFDKTNTTPATVTGLSFTGASGKTYNFRVVLHITGDATGGIRARMGGSSTATSDIYSVSYTCEGSTTAIAPSRITDWATTGLVYTAGCTTLRAVLEGSVAVNAGGVIAPQFAEGSASGTSSVLIGSSMTADQVN
jgi:hypothetical protein